LETQKYKIIISEPWDYSNNDGSNIEIGEIIIFEKNYLLFRSDNELIFDNLKGNLFLLLPRIGKQLNENTLIYESVDGGLLLTNDFNNMNKKELENISKFVFIGSIQKFDE
jgi:hypothetical protein